MQKILSSLTVLALLVSPNLWAWGERAHEAVGMIADDNLSPQGIQYRNQILGTGVTLASVANFADEVKVSKNSKIYETFEAMHTVIIPAGYSYSNMPGSYRVEYDANSIIEIAPTLLKSNKTTLKVNAIIKRKR